MTLFNSLRSYYDLIAIQSNSNEITFESALKHLHTNVTLNTCWISTKWEMYTGEMDTVFDIKTIINTCICDEIERFWRKWTGILNVNTINSKEKRELPNLPYQ